MLAALVTTVLLSSLAPQETQAFRAAFSQRKTETATAKLDPAIAKCMDMVITRLLKEKAPSLTPEKIEQILSFYARAIGDEEALPTDYRSLGATFATGPGVKAVGVRMGAVSSLRVYNSASGKSMPLPAVFGWRYQYDSRPIFMADGSLLVDCTGIQDAGVRYGYQIDCLTRSNGAYKLSQSLRGVWVLEDEADSHLKSLPTGFELRTISSPKSFYTDNTSKLLQMKATFNVRLGIPKREALVVGEPAVQAVDAWMARAMKSPATEMEKRFRAAYGKEQQMVVEWSEEIVFSRPAKVSLTFDKRFDFTLKEKGQEYVVTDLSISR